MELTISLNEVFNSLLGIRGFWRLNHFLLDLEPNLFHLGLVIQILEYILVSVFGEVFGSV